MEFTKRTYTSTFALKTRCGDKVVLSSSSDVLLSRYVCIYKRGYRMRHVLLPSALSILKVCLLTCGNVCRKKKAKIRDRLKTIILFFFFSEDGRLFDWIGEKNASGKKAHKHYVRLAETGNRRQKLFAMGVNSGPRKAEPTATVLLFWFACGLYYTLKSQTIASLSSCSAWRVFSCKRVWAW